MYVDVGDVMGSIHEPNRGKTLKFVPTDAMSHAHINSMIGSVPWSKIGTTYYHSVVYILKYEIIIYLIR